MTVSSAPLTTAFAAAIVKSDPSRNADAMAAARTAIIDFLACTIAGSKDRTTAVLAKSLGADLPGDAILVGTSRRTDPLIAAVVNGYAGHVLDYDDVHASVRGHPTTVIVPALLAFAAEKTFSAEAFISAYVVGLEAMARLGLSLGAKHYENGFHATATLGPIGAAAAIAHLTGASVEETAIALGLAATQASGLRLQFGYDAKPYHAAWPPAPAFLPPVSPPPGLPRARFPRQSGRLPFRLCLRAGNPSAAVDQLGEPGRSSHPA